MPTSYKPVAWPALLALLLGCVAENAAGPSPVDVAGDPAWQLDEGPVPDTPEAEDPGRAGELIHVGGPGDQGDDEGIGDPGEEPDTEEGSADAAPGRPDVVAGTGAAWVWLDPDEVGRSLPVPVHLPHLDDPDGRLTGPYARVMNCLNEPGGVETSIDIGQTPIVIGLCRLEQVAAADETGSFLHIEPPADMGDPNDPFAEVQTYFHMNRVHDFFAEGFGFGGREGPLLALVNVQVSMKIAAPVWIGIENAAFIPGDSIAKLEDLAGVPSPVQEDMLVFAQGRNLDISYDGDVVYHEYTHAVVGDRLSMNRADRFGSDRGPRSLNEAMADYFAAALTESPVMGGYSLGSLGAERDLSKELLCPRDATGEEHDDGHVFASALWTIRSMLGGPTADPLIFDAMLGFGPATSFGEAVDALASAADALDPPRGAELRGLFDIRGLAACERIKDIGVEGHGDLAFVPGTLEIPDFAGSGRAPAYMQHRIQVEEGTAALTLSWRSTVTGLDALLETIGLSAEPAAFELSLLPGEGGLTWTYDAALPASDAVATVPVLGNGESFEVSVAGTCLRPGPHVFQIVNLSRTGAAVRAFKVRQWAIADPEGKTVERYDCP